MAAPDQPKDSRIRCGWAASGGLMATYHDTEWGVPLHRDQGHFEAIVLDGAQAGLSWSTILNKRENYRAAFDGFDAAKVARYDDRKIAELLQNAGIVRNKLKVNSAVINARNFLKVQEEFGSFDRYIWQFVNGKPLENRWHEMKEVPPRTEISDRMSKDLLARGFKFVGSTICYAYMQAAGIVNDHLVTCFRHKQVRGMSR